MIQLDNIQSMYFLGIGGIGMSALARYFHLQGKTVSGYDRVSTRVSQSLEEEGIEVRYHFEEAQLQGKDMIVYTPAILPSNPEYIASVNSGKPMHKRAEILGAISRKYKALAVAGTHGKTTTTTMLTHVLRNCQVDCSAFLGGISLNLNSNFAHGKSPWVVIEADEYDRSFLQLKPEMAVITAVDPDHLDIYDTPKEMETSYRQFASQVTGPLLVHEQIGNQDWGRNVLTYGVEAGNYRAENLDHENLSTTFDFVGESNRVSGLQLRMPGTHNVSNMVAALALAERLGAEPEDMKAAVNSFSGIYRRFEVQLDHPEFTFIDDYAHHPRELEAAIDTAGKLFPHRQLIVVFQPHLYTRTRDFAEGFGTALSKAEVVLLMDIYPAREHPIPGVSSQLILDEIKEVTQKAWVTREELIPALIKHVELPTVLLTLGAGDIDKEVKKVTEWARDMVKSPLKN